ncbi:MAG: hypothetical protein IT424_02250 [Pirellulales bacterium]|nr:hypothetical protein [Pirellulales bacterium]
MPCIHLQQLYKLCQDYDLKLGSSDLVRVVCNQCGEQEVCPSTLMDEYDAKEPGAEAPRAPKTQPAPGQ